MGKIRTKRRRDASTANDNGALRVAGVERLSLEVTLDRAREDLLGLATRSGLEILAAMLERDRERLVGPNRRWDETREAYRYGYDEGAVVMGGRKVRGRKPRVRAASGDGEIMLPSWRWATRHDPLDQRTMQQMLVGVSTRSYAKNLEAGARHYYPELDLVGLPRLDLSVHAPKHEADIGFVRRLDPALKQVDDPAAPATLVLHFVRHREALFAPTAVGLPWADPLECFFDLHESGLQGQASELLEALTPPAGA